MNEGDRIVEVCVELIAGIPQERIRIDLSAQDGSARGTYASGVGVDVDVIRCITLEYSLITRLLHILFLLL